MVELHLAKVVVAGSIPVSRSLNGCICSETSSRGLVSPYLRSCVLIVFSAPWAHVDEMVGAAHGIQIMLDDHDRRPIANQGVEHRLERLSILRVQSDSWFVEHEH